MPIKDRGFEEISQIVLKIEYMLGFNIQSVWAQRHTPAT